MKTAAQLVAEGYGGYAGWGDPQAGYDFQATGGAGKKTSGGTSTSNQTVEQAAQAAVDAQAAVWDREKKFIEQYTQQNPFAFDQQLAAKAAAQEYQPYYTELLQDYLKTAESKTNTIQSEQKYLTELKQSDISKQSLDYTQAVAKAQEGYAGSGMFFSGIKAQGLGQQEVGQKTALNRLDTTYGYQQAGLTQEQKDLAAQTEQKRRDIFGGDVSLGGLAGYTGGGGQYQTAVQGGITQRGQEAVQAYNTPFLQAYQREFPTGSNQIQGYTIPDYLTFQT